MLIDQKQAYLAALVFSSVLAWASFFGIIFFTNPQSAGIFGVYVIYASAIIGVAGSLIILWQIIKLKKKS